MMDFQSFCLVARKALARLATLKRRLHIAWLRVMGRRCRPIAQVRTSPLAARHATGRWLEFGPDERTARALVPALLISFWLCADIIAMLTLLTVATSVLLRNAVLVAVVISILAAGTLGAAFLALQARKQRQLSRRLTLVAVGVIALLSISAASGTVLYVDRQHAAALYYGRADRVIAEKCAEVAALEQRLFRADEKLVVAQCLIQYDSTYAVLRATAASTGYGR